MEKSIGKRISDFILVILLLLVVTAIICVIVFKITTYHIVGNSMNPTLEQNELVLSMTPKEYHRGDIISFETEEGTTIKRIIGLPGEKVFIDKYGTVFINDNELKEEYIKSKVRGDIETPNPYTVGTDEYYVLGDNRGDSKDSRFLKVGCIKKEKIKGHIIVSISKFKFIK